MFGFSDFRSRNSLRTRYWTSILPWFTEKKPPRVLFFALNINDDEASKSSDKQYLLEKEGAKKKTTFNVKPLRSLCLLMHYVCDRERMEIHLECFSFWEFSQFSFRIFMQKSQAKSAKGAACWFANETAFIDDLSFKGRLVFLFACCFTGKESNKNGEKKKRT